MAVNSRTLRRLVAAGAVALALGGASLAGAEVVPGQILVQYRAGASASARSDVRADADVVRADAVTPRIDLVAAAVGDTSAALAELRADPRVAVAVPNAVLHEQVTPSDTWFASQWAPAVMNLPSAWDTAASREGALVAVIDSGIDATHPDLSAQVTTPTPAPWALDAPTNSHGTHVAGIVGATGNNGTGVAGVAWSGAGGSTRHLMDLRVIWSNGTADEADLLSALEYAGAHGARVANGSLGGAGASLATRSLYKQVVDAHPGTLYVFAAGNSATDLDASPGYFLPCEVAAVSPNALCVAATDQGDLPATFTNHGSAVTIAAPGAEIFSTLRSGLYGYKSGTSMAAPQVSGVASLLLQQRPALSGADARAVLQATGRAVPALAGTIPGGGMVDAGAALGGLDPATISGPSAFAISSPATGVLSEQSTATVHWSPSTGGGLVTSYTVTLDGATAATLPWTQTSWTAAGLANGAHTVQVTATDTAGRTATTAAVTINVAVPSAEPAPAPVAAPATPRVSRRAAALAAARKRYDRARAVCRRKRVPKARTACSRAARKSYVAAVARARRLPA